MPSYSSSMVSHNFAQGYLDEFVNCNARQEPISKSRQHVKWTTLILCRYKINYNVAVFKDRDEAGLGVVIHDANGLPMVALV